MADDQNPQDQNGQQSNQQQGGQQPQPPTSGQGNPTPPPPPPAGTQGGPAGQQPPTPTPPPPPPEDTTPANYQIGQSFSGNINIALPAHNLQFDEQKFLKLLAGSISLTKEEKKRIIQSIPKLKQEQVDELIRIFEEEKVKFAELSSKHVDQLKKLEKQHLADWQDIELEQKAEGKAEEDQNEADEIRKKLGL